MLCLALAGAGFYQQEFISALALAWLSGWGFAFAFIEWCEKY